MNEYENLTEHHQQNIFHINICSRSIADCSADMRNISIYYSMIFVQSTEPAEIEAGDVITFAADENLTVVTHRVVKRNDEKRYFITCGDMNNTNDAPVAFESVAGKVVYKIEKIGYVINIINLPAVKWLLIAVLAVLVILMIIQFYRDNKRKAEHEDEKV